MNREKSKKLLPIMQAFAEGKNIEWKDSDGKWCKTENPTFLTEVEYRVAEEPNYAPYKTIEQFLKDFKEHGPYILNSNCAYLPICLNEEGVDVAFKSKCIDWESLLNNYTWQDGSKCGMEVNND